VFDDKVKSLAIQVTPAGARSWFVVKRINGKPVRTRLGSWPDLSVEGARRAAGEVLGAIANGKNPHRERKALRQEATLADLWREWSDLHGRPHKRSYPEDERMFDKYLVPFHHKRLSEIRQTDVSRLHVRLGKDHGAVQANKVIDLLGALFNWAKSRGWKGDNPRVGVPRFKRPSRTRFLDRDELVRFVKALEDEPCETHKHYWLALLLTAARNRNVRCMKWADLNLERGLWFIPAEEAKSGKPMTVILAPPVVRLLNTRRGLVGDNLWVFSRPGRPDEPLLYPTHKWDRLRERAGLPDVTQHDLRRTAGSWMAAAGVGAQVIGAALGHNDLRSTQTYMRLAVDPVRRAVDEVAQVLTTAGGADKLLPAPTEDADDEQAQD